MSQADYFVAQGIYRGWALTGIVLILAILADALLAVRLRGRGRRPFALALLGVLAMAASLAIFFTWTYPANLATQNWTVVPPDWAAWRVQWEYSHAANAVVTFLALGAVTWAALDPHG